MRANSADPVSGRSFIERMPGPIFLFLGRVGVGRVPDVEPGSRPAGAGGVAVG